MRSTIPTLDDVRTGPPTLDVATAGRLLGISRSYAFELARRGEFPCRLLKVGSRYRVPADRARRAPGGRPDRCDGVTRAGHHRRSPAPQGAHLIRHHMEEVGR